MGEMNELLEDKELPDDAPGINDNLELELENYCPVCGELLGACTCEE